MSYELVRERRFSPVLAGVMSFFVPGLGQLYKGQFLGAVLWFLFTGAGYLPAGVPGPHPPLLLCDERRVEQRHPGPHPRVLS